MKPMFSPPYLGAAYYPEDWDESEIDFDINKMKEAGINAVRIGEFAWHKMEPKEGEYDFTFFHKVINKLGEAGIAVILGTPTATPPRWFTLKHPDALKETEYGVRLNHGGRRHCCSNNPAYKEACAKITEAMAKEFRDNKYVIGWQCDNEIYESGDGCLCPYCREHFKNSMKKRYGTVDNLNNAWNLNLFSQWYDSFDDIPLPVNTWINPHHRALWRADQNDSHIEFIHMQSDILHKYVSVPVGTDTMPFNAMNYRRLNEKLDVVQFNHYNTPSDIQNECFWFDFLRTISPRPLWNTETASCWNGNTAIDQSIKPENFCYINSFLPFVLGGEANMYWLWRTHWAGHEMMHGSILDTSGRPQHIFKEIQKTARDLNKSADFLNSTKVKTNAAFHFSSLNWLLWQSQKILHDFDYTPELYDTFYRPLVDLGIRPDVIDCEQSLDNYKILFSPMMLSLDEGNSAQRIKNWVKNGGVWVVGPLSDVRNSDGAKYKNKPFGFLEDLIGECWLYGIPDAEKNIKTVGFDGEFSGGKYYQVFEGGNDSLVNITSGHSEIVGKSIVLKKKFGKGCVYVLGTFPSYSDVKKIYSLALNECGIDARKTPDGNIMTAEREGEARKGLILAEYANKGGRYRLDREMTDILTNRKMSGEIYVKPYEVLILE